MSPNAARRILSEPDLTAEEVAALARHIERVATDTAAREGIPLDAARAQISAQVRDLSIDIQRGIAEQQQENDSGEYPVGEELERLRAQIAESEAQYERGEYVEVDVVLRELDQILYG